MTPEFKKRVLADHGPGRVTMSNCGLCGYFEWRQTVSAQPDDVVVKEHAPSDCPRCIAAFQRAPEVAAWVQGIALKLRRDLAPLPPTFTAEKIFDAAGENLRRRDYYPDAETTDLRAIVEAVIAALALDARAPRPVAGHAPTAAIDMSRIIGCSCGWQTPPGAPDSDDEFARHAAMERSA